MDTPKVSIIILNYNGWADTVECLESVLRNDYPNYEVIVVDNDSPNGSMAYLKAWAEGHLPSQCPDRLCPDLSSPPVPKPISFAYYTKDDVVREKRNNVINSFWANTKIGETITTHYPLTFIQTGSNLGFAGGNNVGIRHAINNGAAYILLLNNDTVVEPSFLREMMAVAIVKKKVAVFGSVILDYYTGKTVFTNSFIDRKLKAHIRLDYANSDRKWWATERVCGAAMMVKCDYITKHALFLDERLFLYGEEMDISMRAKNYGLGTIMVSRSKVYHKEGATTGGDIKPANIYYALRNTIYLAKKLLSLKNQIIFNLFFFSARLVRVFEWSLRGQWDLVKITFYAFRDGFRGKAGKI